VAFKDWPPRELVERPYWFGWGPLTFQRAGVFGQPICLLLTVPWSHAEQLMRKGALADAEVLRTLNAGYFSILVRADRRPDIHARYGTGSWPAMSLLLPDGSPMLSKANPKGLALPITLGYAEKTAVLFHLNEGRKYFETWQNFLQGLAELYQKRVDVEEAKPGPVVADSLDVYTRWLLGNYDGKYGGFGAVPKLFPDGFMELAAERRDAGVGSLMAPARTTLVKWAASPLHDAVGGGFHRLAAAPNWGAIQYEKLLEVNAGIVRDLTELGVSMVQGYIFGKPAPAEDAREIANNSTIEAEGYACIREPRHRLMRRRPVPRSASPNASGFPRSMARLRRARVRLRSQQGAPQATP
jgi:uncharacterized protein YyaL (SSP411 family)